MIDGAKKALHGAMRIMFGHVVMFYLSHVTEDKNATQIDFEFLKLFKHNNKLK